MSTDKGSESFDTDSTFTKLSLYTDLNARRTFISKECRAEGRDCFLVSCSQCVSISAVVFVDFVYLGWDAASKVFESRYFETLCSLETVVRCLFCCTLFVLLWATDYLCIGSAYVTFVVYNPYILYSRHIYIICIGVPRIFFEGGGFNKFSWGHRAERTGNRGR
jgi:hypothetical protein